MFASSIALATLLCAVDPPTLDELLEDADLEDRQRIDRMIEEADGAVRELIALEEELEIKQTLLLPRSMRDAISVRVSFGRIEQDLVERIAVEHVVRAVFSIDFELFLEMGDDRALPKPGSASKRERRCAELGAELHFTQLSQLEERALRARARALGCDWSTT